MGERTEICLQKIAETMSEMVFVAKELEFTSFMVFAIVPSQHYLTKYNLYTTQCLFSMQIKIARGQKLGPWQIRKRIRTVNIKE